MCPTCERWLLFSHLPSSLLSQSPPQDIHTALSLQHSSPLSSSGKGQTLSLHDRCELQRLDTNTTLSLSLWWNSGKCATTHKCHNLLLHSSRGKHTLSSFSSSVLEMSVQLQKSAILSSCHHLQGKHTLSSLSASVLKMSVQLQKSATLFPHLRASKAQRPPYDRQSI